MNSNKSALHVAQRKIKAMLTSALFFRRRQLTIRAGRAFVNFDVTSRDAKVWFYPRYRKGQPHEPAVTFLLLELLEDDSVFFDLGAHVGYFTWLAARVCREGQVHAFEVDPSLVPVIASHSAFNPSSDGGEVFINCAAVMEDNRKVSSFSMQSALNKSTNQLDVAQGSERGCTIQCASVTIDAYLAARDVKNVDVIKIDVEGTEGMVIKGMRQTLSRQRPIVICEVHVPEMRKFGVPVDALIAMFRDHDYRVGILNEHRSDEEPVVGELRSGNEDPTIGNACLVLWPAERPTASFWQTG